MAALASVLQECFTACLSLIPSSVHLAQGSAHVACTGKVRKTRTTPLTPITTAVLATYLQEGQNRSGEALFPHPQGRALSPDALQQRLTTHVRRAASSCPELADQNITVHTL